ncbi:hypothetical protein [Sorangium sp. So ce1078]|uniref:hypothetical protein n=1 Tax=Sorangium sp. So ce1078 TaxID=3133329 RepID=UPI003F60FA1B
MLRYTSSRCDPASFTYALYASALGRPPAARERDGFESLYAQALAEGPDVAEAETGWATLSCLAVVTSTEFLFY